MLCIMLCYVRYFELGILGTTHGGLGTTVDVSNSSIAPKLTVICNRLLFYSL